MINLCDIVMSRLRDSAHTTSFQKVIVYVIQVRWNSIGYYHSLALIHIKDSVHTFQKPVVDAST